MRKPRLVLFQMIVHRVLVLLRNVTVGAHKESLRILCVGIRHSSDTVTGPGGFNFFVLAGVRPQAALKAG